MILLTKFHAEKSQMMMQILGFSDCSRNIGIFVRVSNMPSFNDISFFIKLIKNYDKIEN